MYIPPKLYQNSKRWCVWWKGAFSAHSSHFNRVILYYTCSVCFRSTAHEQLFSLVVKRYLFSQWLKNIVKELSFQKGGFWHVLSHLFADIRGFHPIGQALKKKFRTHVIKLDIAPMWYPPGQYLLVSASNNMLYYLSQWDKIRTTCVVNLMSQDTKFWLLKINFARIRTHNLQDNILILYQCATFTLFKFVQIGYLNS
jgi:hypothetical protein